MRSQKEKEEEISHQEILSAMNKYADRIEGKIGNVETNLGGKIDGLEKRVGNVEQRLGAVEGKLGNVEGEVKGIESQMVTKDYLDEKLTDLKGDMTVMMRKGDHKLTTLVDILHDKKVISDGDQKRIHSLEPFPRS